MTTTRRLPADRWTPAARADRVVRRRYRWPAGMPVDRRLSAWAFVQLGIALRDVQRAVVWSFVSVWRRPR